MKKSIVMLLASLLSMTFQAKAQTASIPNVLDIKSAKQTGAILENNKLVGYFVFYFKERADSKTSAYEIEVFDDNYNAVKSFEVVRPKDSYLLEMVYNGEMFMLFFYDRKTGYEFITFNKAGEQQGSVKTDPDNIPQYDLQATLTNITNGTENATIYPLGKDGFVRQTFTKNKKMGYSLVAYDNNLSVLWTLDSKIDSDMIETIEISEVSAKYITVTKYVKASLMTKKVDLYFLIVDAASGKLIKEVPMGSEEKGKETALKTYFDETENKIVLVGEFFKPGDDFLKDKSLGIYAKELDTEGNVLTTKQYKWVGDIDKFKLDNMTDEELKEAKDGYTIFFHDVVRAKNGHLFLIGEQFRKQVSAGGVAMNTLGALSGGGQAASNFEIRIANMVVLELDDAYELVDMKIIRKKKTSAYLEPGMGVYGTAMLGYYINARGYFDYSFTSKQAENDEFTVVYTDFDRKEEKGAENNDVMMGVIQFKGGEMTATRVPINSESKRFWIQPAKPGYVSIVEYFKKEKRLDMRLEKIAY